MHEHSRIAAEVFLEQYAEMLTDQIRSLPTEHGGRGLVGRKNVRVFVQREDRDNFGGFEAAPIAKLDHDMRRLIEPRFSCWRKEKSAPSARSEWAPIAT